jgi:hypothetical protein
MTAPAGSTVTVRGDDRELLAVLVTLAPLGDRGQSWVKIREREFHATAMLRVGWSSGERALIEWARALWRGEGTVDLGKIASLDERFLLAAMNGLAVYRGEDFGTFAETAIARALGSEQ